jgi:mono/diheme cytochrome c family protein
MVGQWGLLLAVLAACKAPAPPPSAAAGQSLYRSTGCASCHGRDGNGDGPQAEKVPSKPIDLHVSSGFKRGVSDDAIAKTLADGIAMNHSNTELHQTHHELLMPKFDHLTETERHSIALYVISLFSDVDQGRAQP